MIAYRLAASGFFSTAAEIWDANRANFNLELSKLQKVQVGTFLMLSDFAAGKFPPVFSDQRAAYEAEMAYRHSRPGVEPATDSAAELRKPFWTDHVARHLRDHAAMTDALQRFGVLPPARLIEAGCGTGWMSEFLAAQGYRVVATDISEVSISDGGRRVESLRAKGIDTTLQFRVGRMETLEVDIQETGSFDAVIVYEALHHAHDWRKFVSAAYRLLKPNGWLLICNEPNLVHTAVAYRVAKLANTHEIGMSRRAVKRAMKAAGFGRVLVLSSRMHWFVKSHWVAAQKAVV